MKYKIIKKSEYESLLRMKMAQNNTITILDDELNRKTAENVMLQYEIAKAREEVQQMECEVKEAKKESLEHQRALIAINAENARLRSELNQQIERYRALSAEHRKCKVEYRSKYGIFS